MRSSGTVVGYQIDWLVRNEEETRTMERPTQRDKREYVGKMGSHRGWEYVVIDYIIFDI